LISTLSAQTLPTASPESVGLSSERLKRLDRLMEDYVRKERVAGVVTLIIREGKIAHQGVYGKLDREGGRSMRPDAIFRIASQSKAVTSVAAMILVEEGRMLLSDPISKYSPEFKNTVVAVPRHGGKGFDTVPAKKEITIRNLLTHTSGYSYGWGPASRAYLWEDVQGWYFADHDEPIGDAVKRLARLPLDAQPGEKYIYGFSIDILGYLVERVSGMTLAEFFQTRIFDPLKMNDTHFFLPESKIERLSPVYGLTPEGKLELVEKADDNDYVRGPRRCYSGGAGLLSTALDYGRFLLMLLNGGELEGARILSPKTVELMTSNHVGNLFGKQGFGLGFWITEHVGRTGKHGSVGAFGWGGAYHTTYWVDPEEKLVALLMCQLLPATGSDLHGKFETLVYQSIVH